MAKKTKIIWYNVPGTKEKVRIYKDFYYSNGCVFYGLVDKNEEPYADLTVNLNSPFQSKSKAFLDINNCPWAEDFVTANGLGEFTGIMGHSGYCDYPLYDFSLKA